MSSVSRVYDASPQDPNAALCQSFWYIRAVAISDFDINILNLPVRSCPGFQDGMSELVEVTRKAIKERLQGDGLIMWHCDRKIE